MIAYIDSEGKAYLYDWYDNKVIFIRVPPKT